MIDENVTIVKDGESLIEQFPISQVANILYSQMSILDKHKSIDTSVTIL